MSSASPPPLAILGAAPRFTEMLHVGRPNLGDYAAFERRIRDVWNRRWLTNDGPLVQEFEQKLAQRLDVAHVISVCNATVGLEIAVRALGLTGEVIVPAFTFVATAHCLSWLGLQPVFCDVHPKTHQLDPVAAERLITQRTSGILPVHLWGDAAPVQELEALAARRGLKLLFDAAHALGTTYRGAPLGGRGDAEVFSLHATKFVNSGEGGFITTRDAEVAHQLRLLRNFGFAGYDQVVSVGTNGKLSEFAAALGLTSLDSMDRFLFRNRENRENYQTALRDLPGLTMWSPRNADQTNEQYVVLEIDAGQFGLTRDELQAVLKAENVFARRYFTPGCHRMEPYCSQPACAPAPLPVTEHLANTLLQLPTGTAVDGEAIRMIGETIRQAQQRAGAIRQKLGSPQS